VLKISIVHHEHGIKIYGDRDVFLELSNEFHRLANSATSDYAEVQTANIQDYDGMIFSQFRVSSLDSFKERQKISVDEFDINFMVIEDDDFEKMKV
jgi:hypothetical protein